MCIISFLIICLSRICRLPYIEVFINKAVVDTGRSNQSSVRIPQMMAYMYISIVFYQHFCETKLMASLSKLWCGVLFMCLLLMARSSSLMDGGSICCFVQQTGEPAFFLNSFTYYIFLCLNVFTVINVLCVVHFKSIHTSVK